jgi:hypothetical protein
MEKSVISSELQVRQLEEELEHQMELQQALQELHLGMGKPSERQARESVCSVAIATRSRISQLQSQIATASEDVASLASQVEQSSDGQQDLSRSLQLVQHICLQVENLENVSKMAQSTAAAQDALRESAHQKQSKAEELKELSRAHAAEAQRHRHEV